MNRQEFSKCLTNIRIDANCGMNEISRRTGMTFIQIQRLESAQNNYSLVNVLRYIQGLNCTLVLTYNDVGYTIQTYQDIPVYLQQCRRKIGWSRAKLAELAGCSKGGIVQTETQKTVLHIDLFLALASLLELQIIIENE